MLEILLSVSLWVAIAAAGFFWNRYRHYEHELKAQELICADMRAKLASSINFLINSSAKLPVEDREQCFLFLLGTVQIDPQLQSALTAMLRGSN